ncbi:hypothetical protein JOD45_000695 [Scopulibacillus daqui]|uniref:DUF4260 family protein n=1 Tax=Scopulibacillus daqui TaxID=1469162 RepID=A0ABS2PWU0_9BACL|nr:DUF4260 domain-containing protein [Scopulibacillus daqui]MBM7644502.1 hypothetical protein [Scopulibacillus daqui]
MTRKIIHLEGFIILMGTIYLYSFNDFNWWVFFLFLLVPDISVLAYFINQRIGAVIYNLFHTYSISIFNLLIGALCHQELMLAVGLIWTAHIAMDRMLGFGLKYNTSFQDTHIQKL